MEQNGSVTNFLRNLDYNETTPFFTNPLGENVHICVFTAMMIVNAFYLWWIYKGGPAYMKKRQPYNVTSLIRIYNIAQVIICTVFVTEGARIGLTFNYLLSCESFENLDDEAKDLVFVGKWMFVLLRLAEYIETFFYVAKKKYSQITLLHVFHHLGAVFTAWFFIASKAQTTGCLMALLNLVVHMIMYSYFFLSSFKNELLLRILDKFKPWMTIIQLVQFVIIISHGVVVLRCGFNYFFVFNTFNFCILFILFTNFFIRTYILKINHRPPQRIK